MSHSRISRVLSFGSKVGAGIGFYLLVISGAYAITTPPGVLHDEASSSAKSSTSLSAKEQEIKNKEQERVFHLGLKIMENFGCSNSTASGDGFVDLGMKALIEYLQGQSNFPNEARTRVFFSPEEHAQILTGHFSLLNYTEKTDTPESKIRNSSKAYSNAFRALSKILNQDLYLSYGDKTDLRKIAADLDNPRSQYGGFFKKRLRDALTELNKFSSVDHFNVGCRIQGEPKDRKKNKLLVQLKEKDAKGNYVKVHLDEYLKRGTKKKTELVDATVRKGSSSSKAPEKAREEIRRAVDPLTNRPAITPSKPVAKPVPAPIRPSKPSTQPTKPQASKPAPHTATPAKPKVDATPAPAKNDYDAIISKYLSIPQSSLGSYLDSGWKTQYEDLIGALIVTKHRGILTNFSKFASVCAKAHEFTTESQKVWFLKKFFKALAKVESGYNPRNETRESTSTKYRPRMKSLPADVSGKAYIDHSAGLFQLSEEAALYYRGGSCNRMDYNNDVRIGYPDTREMTLRDKNSGIYHEYNGDVRRTILNPFLNSACAVEIMEKLLNRGSLYSESQHWAGLRTQSRFSSSRSKLKSAVRAEVPGC